MGYAIITMEGRITTEPEFRESERGQYCTFGFCVNERFGEQDIASFYDCVANGQACERMKKAKLNKGSHIALNGKLTIRQYQRKSDGAMAKSVNVAVSDFFFLEFKKKDAEQQASASTLQEGQKPRASTPAPAAERPDDVPVTSPDDLPL